MGGEHRHYSAGGQRSIFEWRGVRSVPAGVLRPALPGVEPAPRRELDYDLVIYSANWPAARRHAWMTLLRARAIENQAFVAGVNRVGDDGAGIAHAGDSVVAGFHRPAAGSSSTTAPGSPPCARPRGAARLARQVSRASGCGCLYSRIVKIRSQHETAHAGQPPAGRVAAAGQPAGDRAYLPERQVRVRVGRRDPAHVARREAGLFLHAGQQPHHAPARADAGPVAGP